MDNYRETLSSTIIVDDTRLLQESNSNSKEYIFLQTPQNQRFIHELPPHIAILQRDSLKQYFNTNIKIIGITGTNGKTTTAAAIYSLLLDSGHKVALLGTRGMFVNDKQIKPKGLTTPSLLELYQDIDYAVRVGCEYFIMEVSSHAIKQERIYGLDFFIKILTNITSDHLDYHKTLEDYVATKLSFLQAGDSIKIINLDEKNAAKMRFLKNVFSYGIESKGNLFVNAYSLKEGIFAQVTLRIAQLSSSESEDIHHESVGDSSFCSRSRDISAKINREDATFSSSLFGLFNLSNCLAALLAVKIITRESLQDICNLFANFGGVAGRMEIVSTSPLIIVDFAHTTDGMKQVFEGFKTRDISVVFGAGGDRDKSKRAKMGACAASYAKRIYITNDNPRSENPALIAQEIAVGVELSDVKSVVTRIILDRKEAIACAIQELPRDSVLLILGKGDEEIQIFKDTKIPFSDKKCVLDILKEMQNVQNI
ncbi:UDP-N-acetylmuramoyl-L-alanyl-D-glutamate--2,6-diaminopimelate ligase [Helicobacter aurati]|uniref:UDP-N-acetylmuramoyl-L-alanyl-D-glutamate--2, 6-diaminopimelate ligase n=1 Tax=Helicobacter aurati TaxID=137778 RepID=A0A3D8J8K7_9HELI|nr:UDP-N-acetylmuramoyl-L-alanyl-D-glutamate--2,6-diaminopimelate ligase [Helicobacter aurati]RDU73833.1 UDP-N-acetylmuramoyl-L-alanyl-D-glutamate--2,6-diaminopimelate ligase [Helicobacter aurati]